MVRRRMLHAVTFARSRPLQLHTRTFDNIMQHTHAGQVYTYMNDIHTHVLLLLLFPLRIIFLFFNWLEMMMLMSCPTQAHFGTPCLT